MVSRLTLMLMLIVMRLRVLLVLVLVSLSLLLLLLVGRLGNVERAVQNRWGRGGCLCASFGLPSRL